ncbi:Gypsy retrotransposon integrase-like protein 1 [Dissostichus eleginoides]|uniref:Gypsy retrotransposon integrase-like protein 1 n=1 Tax=Dissostichus eleginoides TaxID=100907 RepID=A0AAD9BUT6_DISEL|nr:Gypsy retrotransposon integrase-like protein 1 [Dissostichus eleginoides]
MDNNLYQTIVDYKRKGQYPLDSTKTFKKDIRRKASTYFLDDGALYYMKGPGKATKSKVVIGAEEANAIFIDFHDSATG